jgi:hypothetical protein
MEFRQSKHIGDGKRREKIGWFFFIHLFFVFLMLQSQFEQQRNKPRHELSYLGGMD